MIDCRAQKHKERTMSESKSGPDWAKTLAPIGGVVTAFALVTALGGLTGGCTAPPAPAATATPVFAPSTSVPTSAQVGLVNVLADDFDDPQSGWETGGDADGQWGYKRGVYRIAVDVPDLAIWANRRQSDEWADAVVEIEAYRTSGPIDNQYGVIVRYRDNGNFYLFSVSSDGLYSVQMLRNDQWIDLQPWTISEAVRQESGVNVLRVECQGSLMRFFINDQYVAEVEDSTFASGSMALLAGSFAEGGVVVHFDSIRVQAAD
jgi:hypothetical protein